MERRNLAVKSPLFCSCRLILSIVSCLGVVCMYSVRFNMVVALPCMVHDVEMHSSSSDVQVSGKRSPECNGDKKPGMKYNSSSLTYRHHTEHLHHTWDEKTQAKVTGSFFWSYWITQIPGGWLSERYGGKLFFGWAIFISGVITLLIPFAAEIDYWVMIFLRMLLGLIQGVTWPSMFVVWSRWAPPLERQRLISLCISGSTFGIVLTYPTMGIMCELNEEGWENAFFVSGSVAIVWCLIWYYYVYDAPSEHPRITTPEKEYIHKCLKKTMSDEKTLITPWGDILTSPAVWTYVISDMANAFQVYALLSFMTIYLQDIHKFQESEAAKTVAIPYIGFFAFTNISAAVFDLVVTRKLCSADVARKTGNSIGFLLPAIVLIFVGFLNCTQSTLAVACLILINTITGVQWGAGYLLSLYEIAPQHIGVIYGITNTLSTFSGLISLTITERLTVDKRRTGWQILFLSTSAVFILETVIFIVFGSAELQKWAKTPDDRKGSTEAFRKNSVIDQIPKMRESSDLSLKMKSSSDNNEF